MTLIVEAVRSAFAQPVAATISALIIAGVCAVILSTTGQTVQAEQQVLARIDDAGTRSIIISDAAGDAGITPAAVERISRTTGVEWVVGFGPATDARAAGIPAGNPAAIRSIHGDYPAQIEILGRTPDVGEVLAGATAQQTLGLQAPSGGVISGDTDFAIVGGFTATDPLQFLNRSLLRAANPDDPTLRSIHILVASPGRVADVTDAALLLLGPDNPTSVAVETSETLADVRAAVAGDLGRFSRQLVALVLSAGLVLTALAVYGAVTSRRKDFGRRRALGASRPTIVTLVALQTGVSAAIGALVGTIGTAVVLTQIVGQPPEAQFTAAIALLAILTAVVASLPPAVVAAYRDPVKVLRVP